MINFNPELFSTRLQDNINILMQCRNLCGYGLASEGKKGIFVQVNQRLQAVINGLMQEVEEIRAQGKPFDESLLQYLSAEERADLSSLDKHCSDLGAAVHLLGRFKQRLIRLACQRRIAGDFRGIGQ